ncbi:late endosomal/lysosomal adaptor, MAPK and MTOR activator 5 [Anticarsia gemmatalis]|uniref:late endosomal/lysosomal adaptor, MAPK and MTOR activator 5 n=1 Tax=Anticarsia gemmatalis TaxID=129554 RepID=UPI003F775AC8
MFLYITLWFVFLFVHRKLELINSEMEKELDRVVEEIMSTPNVSGCLVADHQGLCLAAKGSAHVDSAGIIVAISEQACKIQPNLKPPTVCLETEKKQCLIQRHGTITGAIFKQKA